MNMNELNICFVCAGNACRSPYAEAVLRKIAGDASLTGLKIWSCGTIDWGQNPRDEVMTRIAEEMGYKMTGTTTFMSREPLLEADIIIVFEKYQRDLLTRVLDYDHRDRIRLFDQLSFDANTDVDDPSSEREHIYRTIALHIEEGCRRILNRITKDESNY